MTASPFPGSPQLLTAPVLLAVVALIKIGYLLVFGPIADSNDLPMYVQYARLLVEGKDLLGPEGIEEHGRLSALFRTIGYPAIMAASMLVAGEHWAWPVAAVQGAACVIAVYWIWRATMALSGSPLAAFLAGLAYATGLALRFDLYILTDSLTAHIFVVVAGMAVVAAVQREAWSFQRSALVAALLVATFLLRDGSRYIAVLLLPVIVLAVWPAPSRLLAAARLAVIYLPLVAAVLAYQAWNEARTGERFVTTIGQNGFFYPLMKVAAAGTPVFDEDTPLDRLAREHFKDYDFFEFLVINKRLQAEHGMTEPGLAKLLERKWVRTWIKHPWPMLRFMLSNVSPRQALYVVSAQASHNDLATRVRSEYDRPSTIGGLIDSVREGKTPVLSLVLFALQGAVSLVLFLAFVAYPPLLAVRAALRRARPSPAVVAMAALWLFYWGNVFFMAILTFQPRYVMAPMAVALMIGLTALTALARRRFRASSLKCEARRFCELGACGQAAGRPRPARAKS